MRIALWQIKMFLLFSAVVFTQYSYAQPPEQTLHETATKLVEKMRAEKISPQKAWEDGLLTKPILVYVLGEDALLDSGRGLWNPASETYEWAQLLVDKFPELIEQPGTLSNGARVRMALLFLSKRDARGAQIMENILDTMPREQPDMLTVNAVIYNLSNYYRYKGDNVKAIATSLKAQEFTNDPMTLSNLILGAARATYAAGDKEGAKQLYNQVIGYGYGWTTGHVYSDLARHLFKEGKLEEGRALLKKPIEGLNADQIRVVLNHQLAQSYYETGEWEEALKYAQATIDQYNSLANPIKDHGLEYFPEAAKRMPQQIEQWKNKPVQLYPERINLKKPKDNKEPVRTYFNIHSYRAITVKAVSTDPNVKVWPLQSPSGYESRNTQMIGVEITPAALEKDLKAEIVVTLQEFPDVTFRVPVTLQKEDEAQDE